jgi:hypothetical protein
MNTTMHLAALPDDDPAGLSDPADVAEALVAIIRGDFVPGAARVEVADVTPSAATPLTGV